MKKIAFLLMTIFLAVALAACGDDQGKADEGQQNEAGQEVENDGAGNEGTEDEEWPAELINQDAVNNEFFIQVHQLLEDNGYEVGELIAADYSFFNAEMAAAIEINEEDMFPLQIYELNPDDENLEYAKESGQGRAEYAGEKAEIPVLVIDHYYFFLAEGHPDQEAVYKLLEENLK